MTESPTIPGADPAHRAGPPATRALSPDSDSSAPAAQEPDARELDRALRARLLRWARAAQPREACGLLLGHRDASGVRVVEVTRARNLAAGSERFLLDPGHLVRGTDDARARGLELLGTWHSHPRGPAAPSAADRLGAWPGTWNLVVVPGRGRGPRFRGWTAPSASASTWPPAPGPADRGSSSGARVRP